MTAEEFWQWWSDLPEDDRYLVLEIITVKKGTATDVKRQEVYDQYYADKTKEKK